LRLIKIELADEKFQYVIFAAEPYENIAFKVPNLEIDNSEGKYLVNWDKERKVYTVQLYFKERRAKQLPALPQKPISFNPIGVRF
jgi:splicing factor 3A subunit 2